MSYGACFVCPRNCGVDRSEQTGYCNLSDELKIAKYMLHMWEEPIISGTKGSGAIFFSGCSLKCLYCQNYEISRCGKGKTISIKELSDIMLKLEREGAHNINLVTPTHFTYQIIDALNIYRPKIPIVWNTSGYEKEETLELLAPYVDIYLADFKYFTKKSAGDYSKAPDYPDITKAALLKMRETVGEDVIENGLMKKGLIVRHLVLPSGANEGRDIIDWIYKNLGKDTYVSIMNQYFPSSLAKEHPILRNNTKPLEYKMVINKFISLGMTNGFMQDKDSSSAIFVPDWNF